MGVHFFSLFSLILGLWFGWRLIAAQGTPEGSSLLRWFSIAEAVSYIACFFGLRGYKLWAWLLFLVLILYLLMRNLLATYVFCFRLLQGNIFTVGYEIIAASFLLALTVPLLVAMRILTNPARENRFSQTSNQSGHRLERLIPVSIISTTIFIIHNALAREMAWKLAAILAVVGLLIFFTMAFARRHRILEGPAKE